jgi:outer membrane protein TolC
VAGCTARQHQQAADREVYGIVQRVEGNLFGRTNQFSINTPYSFRKPEAILPEELIEDRLQTNQRVLSVEGALQLAVSQSRRYQAEKERLYLTSLTLAGAKLEFGPQFFAKSSGGLDRLGNGEKTGGVNSQVGVDQVLKSGGRLGVTVVNDLFRYYTGDPRRSAVSTLSVNLAQPLLRGFGKNNAAVESLTQAERNTVYAVRNFSYFQDQFAMEIVNDYFALLAQKDVIRNRYTNFLSRVQSTKRLEGRARDRERLQDVDQAMQAELTAKNNYVNALASFRNGLDTFKIKLGLPQGERVRLADLALREVERVGLVPVALDPEQAFRVAVRRQLQILNAIDKFEDSKRKVRVAKNRLKVDLNLVADASLDSDGATDYTKFDPNQVRAGVGLQLDLPIDRRTERNNYRATQVTFESDLRAFTLVLDNLKDSIERGMRALEQRRQNFYIQRNALTIANRRVDSTTLLQQAGRAEVRDVVEAQDAQIAAQNAVTAALVDYQVARLQLMLDIGALESERPQFWLQDHLAQYLPGEGAAAGVAGPDDKVLVTPEDFFNR